MPPIISYRLPLRLLHTPLSFSIATPHDGYAAAFISLLLSFFSPRRHFFRHISSAYAVLRREAPLMLRHAAALSHADMLAADAAADIYATPRADATISLSPRCFSPFAAAAAFYASLLMPPATLFAFLRYARYFHCLFAAMPYFDLPCLYWLILIAITPFPPPLFSLLTLCAALSGRFVVS